MNIALLLTLAFVGSAIGTGLLRRYALARQVVDVPNERSSHRVPTPRGGGVAIVAAFSTGALALVGMGLVRPAVGTALIGGGGIVALVGFLDDHQHVPARWRLLAHFCAALWVLVWLGGMPPVSFLDSVTDLGLIGDAVAAIALVWLLNLFNFMDGIDGIAGVEVLTVCLGGAMLYTFNAASSAERTLPALLAFSTLGFLLWNFPPAKIFMGDAGSGFLGLSLGAMAVRAAAVSPDWLWSWIILLGVFIVDATVTLLRRLQRREKLYKAHRSHAYQHAAQKAGTHRPVTLAVAAINLIWLLPLALLVGAGRLDGLLGTVIAYAPLLVLVVRLNAGVRSP